MLPALAKAGESCRWWSSRN